MNYGRLVLAIIAASVVIIGFDMVFHGMYMQADYEATKTIWRSNEQMEAMMTYMMAGQVLTGIAAALIFTQFKGHCIGCGIKLGLMLGLIAAGGSLMWYVIIPIPMEMACKWIVAGFASSLLVGIVLALIYKPADAE